MLIAWGYECYLQRAQPYTTIGLIIAMILVLKILWTIVAMYFWTECGDATPAGSGDYLCSKSLMENVTVGWKVLESGKSDKIQGIIQLPLKVIFNVLF